jgi:hypothetical protein
VVERDESKQYHVVHQISNNKTGNIQEAILQLIRDFLVHISMNYSLNNDNDKINFEIPVDVAIELDSVVGSKHWQKSPILNQLFQFFHIHEAI